jgi:hypothetical protein
MTNPVVVMSPIGNGFSFQNANGTAPNTGGFLAFYQAGTSNLITVYTDSTGATPQTNPIPLNSDGRPPYEVWFAAGQAVKAVLQDSNSATIRTYDGIVGINDAAEYTFSTLTVTGGIAINGVTTPPAQSTGWGTPTSPSVVSNFNGTGATTGQIQAALAEVITVLKAVGFLGA